MATEFRLPYTGSEVNEKLRQINVLSNEVNYLKAENLQQTPKFANSIAECTDTTSLYVLPDGYIYAYLYNETTDAYSWVNTEHTFAGPTGKSAYEYAVEADYEGTEDEFADAMANLIGLTSTGERRGKSIIITDAFAQNFRKLNIYGRTTQNGVPTPDNPAELTSVGDEGSLGVTVSGKNVFAEGTVYYAGLSMSMGRLNLGMPMTSPASRTEWGGVGIRASVSPNTTYTVSSDVSPNRYFTITFYKSMEDVGDSTKAISFVEDTNKSIYTFTTPANCYCVVITAISNVAADFTWSWWQLEPGFTATAYESCNEQTLTLSTPNGLPGIPVSSDGNYTDENRQQWICDEIDFASGKYIQRVGTKIITSVDFVNANTYVGAETKYFAGFGVIPDMMAGDWLPVLCSTFVVGTAKNPNIMRLGANDRTVFAYFDNDNLSDKGKFDLWLSENPMTVQYILETPIEIDLSAAELAAYDTLYINIPSTIISNSYNAYMRVKYSKKIDVNISSTTGGPILDYSKYDLPILTLDGDCTNMTKDDYVSLEYTFQGMSGVVNVKKQGASSITTGVEIGSGFDADLGGLFNFTLKFPDAFEAKEGWGAQKKYVFKANAIDHSHARNVCSCKLWGEIVKSRANVPSELSSLPNGGAIDGFPIMVVLNGKFYALGTFNIPKDGWMFGAPKAILCADYHCDATRFKALATLNGDFELEYVEDEDNSEWVLTSLNTMIQAVMNSTGNDLDTTVGQYIDIPSAIDYYIHTVDENAGDCVDKNYILVTFDGIKWYFSAYDRDSTYGLWWDGKYIEYIVSGYDFYAYARYNKLMELILNNKKAELKARAIELRNGVKSEINVANVFTRFIGQIPSAIYDHNAKRWPLLRSTSVSNIEQILNWYRLRRIYLDKQIDAM